MKRATLSDVASMAGVSIKTASRVANHEANVRDATRRKVHIAIEALDYRPDEHARRLAQRRRTSRAKLGNPGQAQENAASGIERSGEDPLKIDWN